MGQVRTITAVLLSIAFAAAGHCYAEKTRIFTEPLAPVHFEELGEVRGIATEIVRAVFAEAGMDPVIEVYPWLRSYQMALTIKDSYIYTINRTTKREPLFKWIGPILAKKTYLYKLKNRKDIEITSYEDAKKYTTAVILGHSLTTGLIDKGFREGMELISTPNKKIQIKVFLKGRSDLITGNQYTIYESLKAEGYAITDVEPVLFVSSKGYYLGANIDTDDEKVEKLRQANDKVQDSGLVEEIIDKYMR
jgi:polar amino acid transport system substrate-binding protein